MDSALDPLRHLITEIVRAELDRRAPIVDLLTTREAADHCSVAVGTVRRWIKEGRVETQHAGRRLRISRTALDAMLAAPTVRGPRPGGVSPEIAAARASRKRKQFA